MTVGRAESVQPCKSCQIENWICDYRVFEVHQPELTIVEDVGGDQVIVAEGSRFKRCFVRLRKLLELRPPDASFVRKAVSSAWRPVRGIYVDSCQFRRSKGGEPARSRQTVQPAQRDRDPIDVDVFPDLFGRQRRRSVDVPGHESAGFVVANDHLGCQILFGGHRQHAFFAFETEGFTGAGGFAGGGNQGETDRPSFAATPQQAAAIAESAGHRLHLQSRCIDLKKCRKPCECRLFDHGIMKSRPASRAASAGSR